MILNIDRSRHLKLTYTLDLQPVASKSSIWRGSVDGAGLVGEEQQDQRSLLLTKVDFSKVVFELMLKAGETEVSGEVVLERFKESSCIRLDAQIFQALWQDYEQKREKSVLEWLRKNRGVTTGMTFLGTVLLHPSDRRSVLCLFLSSDEEWHWHYYFLDDSWSFRYSPIVLII